MVEDKKVIQYNITTSVFETVIVVKENLLNLINTINTKKNENHTSFYNKEKQNKIIETINSDYEEELKDLIKAIYKKDSFKITDAWVQKYNNSHHSLHTHGMDSSSKSFVWYIKIDKKASPIKFYNPGFPYCFYYANVIQPKTNKFVIFDSYIPHEVLFNHDAERIVISGNIKVWQK